MSLIHIQNLCKHFKILNRREALGGALRDLFSGDYRTVEAVVAFTFVIPIEFVAFYPSQLFLRPSEVSPLVYFSPMIGIGRFAVTYWIWTQGVNSYTGTGS